MDIEILCDYFLSKNGAEACFPFDDTTLVYKVGGKIFGLVVLDEKPHKMNLKCNPELAIELRERYSAVLPGYHMSKVHWNTIVLDDSVSDELIKEWIDGSYNLVFKSLTKSIQKQLQDEA